MKPNGINSKKRNKTPLMITLAAVVLLIIISLATSGDRTVSWLESTAGAIFNPLHEFASGISDGIIVFTKNLFNTTDADKENAQLKAQLAQLEVAVAELEEIKLENERLRELLSFAEDNSEYSYVGARVTANSGTAWFDTFTLNAGRDDGVNVGDPVINADGLIGLVADVGASWCKVRALIDSQSSIGVLVERTRDNGFARGVLSTGANGELMELYFLSVGSDLVPGDRIVTNGLGSTRLPKGLLVGTVSEVKRASGTGTNDANAIITPAVDYQHLENVMIVVWGAKN